MAPILDFLRNSVLLLDGAMGTQIQSAHLEVEKDFWGKENCSEVLNLSRPDFIRAIHQKYFEAGSDAVETNSFGGSPLTLAEFGLEDQTFEINNRAAELAHEAREQFNDGRARFVIGAIGPGTKLPSLGHIDYQSLEDAFYAQAEGLIAGGSDAILVETCQDPLQVKAAVNGAKRAIGAKDIPIMAQVTVETTGTMLVGTEIAAAASIIGALDVPILGMNCATGPQEMAGHIQWLAENWQGPISVLPNAGLPEVVDGKAHFPLSAPEMARWLERFITEDGVNIIGGCCGTNENHIAALDAMLKKLGQHRPAPKERKPIWIPGLASMYSPVSYAQENAYFSIGERCNANGSKRFRQAQEQGDWEACVALGKEQVSEGSHALDLCTAFVGRNEVAEMSEMVTRLRGAVTAPMVIDSTELPVLEAALKLYGGKPILNSIHFEDGEEPARKRLELAKRFGTAVVALTIDEEGMAKTAEKKLEIAKRLYEFACGKHGLPAADLFIDPLTFTICTGNSDDRKLGIETLDGIALIKEALPECQIVLGLSNISFGLLPAARHVLNSVYLEHARAKGLTSAIVDIAKIMPLHKIPEHEVKAAENLIFDRWEKGADPLQAFMALFEGRKAETKKAKKRADRVEERLKDRIVDGDRAGLEEDLQEAMKSYEPIAIINDLLLSGMKIVGDLFGSGKMQLPFVLQSAETMKAAVKFLEPHMEKTQGQEKGTIVLATVKGDVHDIGKNLVDIILTNNGYKVYNLGIKQPIADILTAIERYKPDAVGMSGLLVKSTVIMKENLEELSKQQISIPVLLGGAALTRHYVEEDCVKSYASGRVAYAGDAFEGLELMQKVAEGKFDVHVGDAQKKREGKPSSKKKTLGGIPESAQRPIDWKEVNTKREQLGRSELMTPPFWGAKIIEQVSPRSLVPYLNEQMLFTFHWGFRKQGRSVAEHKKWLTKEVKPILARLLKECEEQDILRPQAAYGYFPAASDGNDLVVFDPETQKETARFHLPRQNKPGGLCIADFFRDVKDKERDVLAMQVVTVGQHASDVARDWFQNNRYQDYLYLHGLGVEMAEAMAEYVHKRIRAELGFAGEDARDIPTLLKQGYRGSRYSFGYPACPNLADQEILLKLLHADKIGVELSDEFQLHPEQSTSALVVLHPQAKYFNA